MAAIIVKIRNNIEWDAAQTRCFERGKRWNGSIRSELISYPVYSRENLGIYVRGNYLTQGPVRTGNNSNHIFSFTEFMKIF